MEPAPEAMGAEPTDATSDTVEASRELPQAPPQQRASDLVSVGSKSERLVERQLSNFKIELQKKMEELHVDMVDRHSSMAKRVFFYSLLACCGSKSNEESNCANRAAEKILVYVRSKVFEFALGLGMVIWTIAFLLPQIQGSQCQVSADFDGYAHSSDSGWDAAMRAQQTEQYANLCSAIDTNVQCGNQYKNFICRVNPSHPDSATMPASTCKVPIYEGVDDESLLTEQLLFSECQNLNTDLSKTGSKGLSQQPCIYSHYGCRGPSLLNEKKHTKLRDLAKKSSLKNRKATQDMMGQLVCACQWRPKPEAELIMPIISTLVILFLLLPMALSAFRARVRYILGTFEFWYKAVFTVILALGILMTSPWRAFGYVSHFCLVLIFGLLLALQDALPLRMLQEILFGVMGIVWFSVLWASLAFKDSKLIEWRRKNMGILGLIQPFRLDGFMQICCVNLIVFFLKQTYNAYVRKSYASTLQVYIPLDRGSQPCWPFCYRWGWCKCITERELDYGEDSKYTYDATRASQQQDGEEQQVAASRLPTITELNDT